EFFHWHALADPRPLFRFHGRGKARKLRHCTFEPRNFARWCQGDTNFPLVNALMHQLVATGWMSNRGRQIAASCLIHEYGIDWRYGAAFFEQHLIDYEVASNYGNWQYIAGVGADPRGGRHFNIDKQTAEHDPEGVFVAKWDGQRAHQPDYVVDAADWPI
ncbi:MAG: FAD-binding domain-containing protein, partial [Lamprobacter sp.]|uniref:FAD-binding domain-containing protein n=1 Tax=Lamprobacter sp. TaxID=3100796 RepID=UPI002B2574E3